MDLIGMLLLVALVFGVLAIAATFALAGWSFWCWADNGWHDAALEIYDDPR